MLDLVDGDKIEIGGEIAEVKGKPQLLSASEAAEIAKSGEFEVLAPESRRDSDASASSNTKDSKQRSSTASIAS